MTTAKANEAHDHPVTGKRTGLGGIAHTHETTAIDAAIAALDARVSALNAAVESHDGRLDVLEDAEPPPVDPPPTGTRVTSVAALLTALSDNAVTDIVVANGTYRVSIAAAQRADSLWIGARFAPRTAPVTVRAETKGGVTFDGGGANTYGAITFTAGAHDQTWDGFVFANGTPCGPDGQGSGTGMVVIGGYSGMAATHHITLRNITLKPTQGTYLGGHGVYFSWSAAPGPHDILIDGLTISAAGVYMTSGVTFYHSDAANPNAHDVIIRNVNLTAKAVDQGLLPWDDSLDRLTFEDWTLAGIRIGCQYECSSAVQGVVFRRWNSTGSQAGWVSTKGNPPPGVTFDNCSFH